MPLAPSVAPVPPPSYRDRGDDEQRAVFGDGHVECIKDRISGEAVEEDGRRAVDILHPIISPSSLDARPLAVLLDGWWPLLTVVSG